jgi:MFS family permease
MSIASAATSLRDRLLGSHLWTNQNFLRLWAGQAISETGSQFTLLALPTIAILSLNATPWQIGVLAASEYVPFPILGLLAGAIVDRRNKRTIMIACDSSRLVLLASVPVAFALGLRHIEFLYVVGLLSGVFGIFYAVSYSSILPGLVEPTELLDANAKLEISRSTAYLVGPAAAGLLIQAVGAVNVLYIDAASFGGSVVALLGIRPPQRVTSAERSIWAGLKQGARYFFSRPVLWKTGIASATSNLGANILRAVYLVFLYRVVHLPPKYVGLILAGGAIGALVGAMTARSISRQVGIGWTLIAAQVCLASSMLAITLAQYAYAIPILLVCSFVSSAMYPIYNVNVASFRQSITAPEMQGRVNATARTIVWSTVSVGALIGGLAGGVSIPGTIVGAAAITALSIYWLAIGMLRYAPARSC